MSDIISRGGALELLSTIIDSTNALSNPKGLLIHSEGVGDKAREVASQTTEHYPQLPIDVEAIACAGYLHDIGRPLSKTSLKQIGHEIRSSNWISLNGLEAGIAGSIEKVNEIGKMTRSHANIFEQWTLSSELREEFKGLDPYSLYPRTFAEVCVTYGDLADLGGRRVDIGFKLDDAIKRYGGDLSSSDNLMGDSLIIARPRLLALATLVEQYSRGEIGSENLGDHFIDLKSP